MRYDSIYLTTASELVESNLWGSSIRNLSVNPDEERFVYGFAREDFFESGENIYNLTIENQKPDEIIEYEAFGKTWYVWYYNDLKSDKSYKDLKFTLKK